MSPSSGGAGAYQGYYGTGTAHTYGVLYSATAAPEIKALARALGGKDGPGASSPRLPVDDFAAQVFDYVRANIKPEFRFGLGKGARGAVIDQSGTPFDQAELMVKILREGGVTANYRLGTIELNATQFGKWTGLVYNLNESNQTFSVNALAACTLLADGGIPATVNSQSTCTGLTGNLSSVTLMHIWVEVNGKLYDPSYKQHTLKAGLDLPLAMGCGTEASPTCGSLARTSMMTGASTGNYGSGGSAVPWVQNLNEGQLNSRLNTYATNLATVIKNTQERYAPLEHVIGGTIIDKAYNPAVGATLPYPTPNDFATWTGDIPDQYRTTLRVQLHGIDQTLYADEAYGKDLAVGTYGRMEDWTRWTALYANNVQIGSTATTTANVNTDDIVTFSVNHPYAGDAAGGSALNGTLGDDSQALYAGEDHRNSSREYVYSGGGFTGSITDRWVNMITLIWSVGETGPTYQSLIGELPSRVAPAIEFWPNGYPVLEAHRSNAAQYLVQRNQTQEIAAGVAKSAVSSHHVMGVAYGIYRLGGVSAFLNVVSAISASHRSSDSTRRTALFETVSVMDAMTEGSVILQAEDSWDTFTGPTLIKRANDASQRFMRVNSANWSTASSQLSSGGYNSTRRTDIQWFTNNGYQVVLPRNASPGNVSIDNGSFSLGPSAEIAISSSRMAFTIGERLKGTASAAGADPFKGVMDAVKLGEYSLRSRKAYSLDAINGGVTLSAPPDLVVGNGEFPRALAFGRTYSSESAKARKSCYTWFGDNYAMGNVCMPGGGGASRTKIAGSGGWKHSFEISAEWSNNGLEGLGVTSGLRAATAVADVYAAYDVVRNVTTANRLSASLMASMTSYHLGRSFVKNTFTFHLQDGIRVFAKLPDGTFDAPINEPGAQLQSNLTRSDPFMLGSAVVRYHYGDTTLTYKSSFGHEATFQSAGGTAILAGNGYGILGPQFVVSQWKDPNGVTATFNYEDVFDVTTGIYDRKLTSVANNLGYSISVTATGRNITSVSDGTRTVTYSATGSTACPLGWATFTEPWSAPDCPDSLTVTGADGGSTIYSYLPDGDSPDPAVSQGPAAALRKWFTPSSSSVPYLTLKYDEMWHVTDARDPLAHTTRVYSASVADEKERLGEIVDATGASSRTYADTFGNPVAEVNALGFLTTHEYTAGRKRSRTTHPEGNYDVFAYDVRGNRTSATRHPKAGSSLPVTTVSTTYVEGPAVLTCANLKTCNQIKTETDPNNNTTTYDYLGSTGQLQRITGPVIAAQSGGVSGSSQADFCYGTPYGLTNVSFLTAKIEKVSSSATRVTSYWHDYLSKYQLGLATTDPSTTYVPPASAGGTCTTTSKSGALNLATSITYDPVGNVATINGPIEGTGDTTTYYFDRARRLTGVLEPLGGRTRHCFDADGLLVGTHHGRTASLTDPNVGTATTTGQCSAGYAAAQWLSESRAYYATGDLLSVTDANNHQTFYAYDAVGRPRVVQDPDGRQTATVYDAAGQTIGTWKGGSGWLSGSGGATTVSGSAPTAATPWNPGGYGSTGPLRYGQYGYTPNGKQSFVRDANNNQTDHYYDGHDRLRFTLFPDKNDGTRCNAPNSWEPASLSCSGNQTYELSLYDAVGNLVSFRNRRNQTTGYTYDQLNRMAVRTPPDTGAVTFGMNLMGENLLVSRAASGLNAAHTTAYTYDAAGRKLTETTDGQTVTAAYDTLASVRDNAGQRTRTTWADGYFVSYGYDVQGRMSHVRENSTSAGELAYYSYDALSRRNYLCLGGQSASCVGGGGTNKTTYSYDPASRLEGLSQILNTSAVGLTYGRNNSGQITALNATDAAYLPRPATASNVGYTPNKLNQYDSVGGQALSHDLSGNLTTWMLNGVLQTYTYDSENRLITAVSGGTTTNYEYDGLGRRVSKNVGGLVTRYVLDGDEEIAELNSSNVVQRRYIMGTTIDDRVARAEGSTTTNPTKYYYHVNHQGSVIAMSDAAGNLQQQIGYDEYGKSPAPASGEPYRYTGRRYDAETGLYYYRARYYTPDLGRFLQVDPIGYEDDINLYAYTYNDPGNRTDPTGLCVTFGICGAMSPEAAKRFLGTVADFAPGVSDLKAGAEAIANPTPTNVTAAAVGLLPVVGDVTGKILKNSDLVVRGGAATPKGGNSVEGISAGTGTHPSGVTGFSAEASPGATLCELCSNIPNNHVGVTTVGDVRAAGGDVVPTSGKSPNHVTVTGISPPAGNALLTPTVTNPVPPELRKPR